MLGTLWLIPILCLAGAVLNLLLGVLRAPKRAVTAVGVGSVGAATLAGFAAIGQYLVQPQVTLVERYFTWIRAGNIAVDAALLLDPLSVVAVGFVTFVGFLIHVYSVGYMHGETDAGYARYFAYLNLFMFSMLVLVLGSNLALMFVGWEGVGLCSYLLIGYFYDQEFCAAAGKKAFIVNRIGDFGFMLAMFATLATFGTAEFLAAGSEIAEPVADGARGFLQQAADGGPALFGTAATLIGLLLFVGAIGKSAQIPLYVWLPDAMAGPTPVSALIHAATMVTAGVFMVVRCNVLYRLSPTAMLVVAAVGGVTAIFAATIGLVQNDIKKVLAYSTVSQLGYMFLGAGVGAFIAAIFHVVTHAFFKACLFLGSGSVIHGCQGEQDIRKMGGLKKHMPTTYWTFLVATIAIAGIPPLAGFVSKDQILGAAFAAGSGNLNHHGPIYFLLWVLGLAGAVMTAFYMFRLLFLTFHGSFRGGAEAEHHVHESPRTMTLPLVILAGLSAVGGLVLGFPGVLVAAPGAHLLNRFLGPVVLEITGVHEAHHEASLLLEWGLVFVSVGVAVFGIWLARRFYLGAQAGEQPRRLAERHPAVYRLLLDKYRVDELYEAVVVRPLHRWSEICYRVVDTWVIDGAVNLSAFSTELSGTFLRFLQTGNVRNYALSVVLGIIALALILS